MATATMNKNQGNIDQAKSEANTAASKASEALGHAGQAVTSAATAVGQKVGEAASAVGQRVEDATTNVAKGAQSLADTVRKQGPQEGVLGQATRTVASSLEQAGRYVEDKHLTGMADDIGSMIKSHPIPAVLIGLGVGFLLGRALRD